MEERSVFFKDIVSHLKGLGERKNFFLTFAIICKLLFANPATSTRAERSLFTGMTNKDLEAFVNGAARIQFRERPQKYRK